jgi:hypothetical protein
LFIITGVSHPRAFGEVVWSRRFRGERGLEIMAKRRKKSDKRWMWVVKLGDSIFVSRTAVLLSKQLSRRDFRVLEEVVNIYSRMLGDVLSYASILLRINIGLRMGSIES